MKNNLIIGQGFSKEREPTVAARIALRAALEELNGAPISLGLLFFSRRYAEPGVLDEIFKVLGDAPFLGCTTSGEILNGPIEDSFSVTLLSSPYIEAEVCHVKWVSDDPDKSIQELLAQKAVVKAMDKMYQKEISRQGKRSLGILFPPGPAVGQDSPYYEVFLALKDALGESVPIVGACAGDNWAMKGSWVLSPNGIIENSIGFIYLVTSLRFGIGMSHGFVPTNRRAIVTKVAGNTVLELNNQPARTVVPWLFQVKPEEVFMSHIALKTGQILGVQDRFGRYQLLVPRFLTKGGGLRLSQPLYPNTQMEIMKPGEALAFSARDAISRALVRAQTDAPVISFVFSCALPWKLLGDEGKLEEYRAIRSAYGDIRLSGFYSMGEYGISLEGINRPCNGAVSALVFSDELWDAAKIYIENQQLISALKEKQVQLEDAYKEWEFTFDSIPISIAIVDQDFNIKKLNKTMADALSMSKDNVIGQKCFKLVHIKDSPPDNCPLQSTFIDGLKRINEMYEPNLGGWNLVGVAPFKYEDGKVISALHYAININAQKQLEEAKERLKKLEMASTISAGISHDFNNLLMIILGNIELAMLKLSRDDPMYENLVRAKDTVLLAAELVRRFEISSGRILTNPVRVDLEPLILRIASSKTQGSGIKMSFEKKSSLPAINVDADLIRKAFENIIENAVESMGEKGELKIILETQKLLGNESLHLVPGDYVKITVEDTGKGIIPEHLSKIFDPYFSTKPRGYRKGMGLGLSEAIAIVHVHGGTISVESRVGMGTKVSVYLPVTGEG